MSTRKAVDIIDGLLTAQEIIENERVCWDEHSVHWHDDPRVRVGICIEKCIDRNWDDVIWLGRLAASVKAVLVEVVNAEQLLIRQTLGEL